jgi:hypothetical protein
LWQFIQSPMHLASSHREATTLVLTLGCREIRWPQRHTVTVSWGIQLLGAVS